MVTLATGGTTADVAAAWSKLADLRPRLADHVETSQHSYRGEHWLVLSDRITGAHFRCSSDVQPFLERLDGKQTVEEAYAASFQDTDAQLDAMQLLAALQSAQLLLDLAPRDTAAIFEQQQKLRKQRWLRKLASPLAIQVPLLDPDAWLARIAGHATPFLTRRAFHLWLLLLAIAALLAVDQWEALGRHWDQRFLDPGNLLLLWLLYPLVKGLHELGHGLTTRAWGGEVHEMGVMLLVFTPVPYVEASASAAFPDRYQRMVVAAAGIMVELLLAAIALVLWIYSEPGLLRDTWFNIMAIGGLSTLLFNGNPLLRFDGYYVLTDLLEMPNLRTRANDCLGALLKQGLFALRIDTSATASGRERNWLLGYSVLSGIYRLFIGLTIALFVAGKYFFIGMALALMVVMNQIVLPLARIARRLWQQAGDEGKRQRLGGVSASLAALAVLLLFFIPINNSTQADGIVKLPDNTELRARADGFVLAVHKQDGDPVSAGDLLMEFTNHELETEVAVLTAKARELDVDYNSALSGEPVELEILKREIDANAEELREAREQLANLAVSSPSAGIFALPGALDLPGRFVRKGELVGHVISDDTPSVRVVLPQGEVDRVRLRTRDIEVRLLARPLEAVAGTGLRDVPMATNELPSALLGSRDGGDIAVDARDIQGRRATQPVFQLEISLPDRSEGRYLGRRALVRFDHYREPIGRVWLRQLRQKLLTELDF